MPEDTGIKAAEPVAPKKPEPVAAPNAETVEALDVGWKSKSFPPVGTGFLSSSKRRGWATHNPCIASMGLVDLPLLICHKNQHNGIHGMVGVTESGDFVRILRI